MWLTKIIIFLIFFSMFLCLQFISSLQLRQLTSHNHWRVNAKMPTACYRLIEGPRDGKSVTPHQWTPLRHLFALVLISNDSTCHVLIVFYANLNIFIAYCVRSLLLLWLMWLPAMAVVLVLYSIASVVVSRFASIFLYLLFT